MPMPVTVWGLQASAIERDPVIDVERTFACGARGLPSRSLFEAKKAIRHWLDRMRAAEVLLFYFGPVSGACFLSHDLNALGARVTIMEDQAPGHAATFRFV